MTTRLRTLLCAVTGAGISAALGLIVALHAPTTVDAPADVQPLVMQRIDAIPAAQPAVDAGLLAVAFGPGSDYTAAQAAEVALTADRTCEALRADVPTDAVTATLVRTTGMLPDQAHAFAELAAAGCQL